MEWREFGRTHAHGWYLETGAGQAEIEDGYTDHQLRVWVQRGEHPATTHRFGDMADAKAWAEAQLN